ncbi:MAG: hypothetical protein HC884_05730 [Chloroflexaceae bacterium]|nr:hypothetical protein [Chloroflexaceae bacterium]
MSEGTSEVLSMRETIKNLLHIIPGYQGYAAREQRRDADQALRDYLAQHYGAERQALMALTRNAVEAGAFGTLEQLEGITQTLDRFIARLESAPRGYTSWFSEARIDESDLDRLYAFDAAMADHLPLLHEQIAAVGQQIAASEPGHERAIDEALTNLRALVDGLHTQFDARQELLAAGKQIPGKPPLP